MQDRTHMARVLKMNHKDTPCSTQEVTVSNIGHDFMRLKGLTF